jgi:hypothetical protein
VFLIVFCNCKTYSLHPAKQQRLAESKNKALAVLWVLRSILHNAVSWWHGHGNGLWASDNNWCEQHKLSSSLYAIPWFTGRPKCHAMHFYMFDNISQSVATAVTFCHLMGLHCWFCDKMFLPHWFLFFIFIKCCKKKKVNYPCNRQWRPIELWDAKAPTFSRQSAHRWRSGGFSKQPFSLAYFPTLKK